MIPCRYSVCCVLILSYSFFIYIPFESIQFVSFYIILYIYNDNNNDQIK